MIRFLASRLLAASLVLAAMSFVIFALIGLMPGDPLDLVISSDPDITQAGTARLREIYGVDTPISARYRHWILSALQGDLGFSRTQHRPVLDIVVPALGNTILLTGTAFVVAKLLALALGTVAALHPGRWPDRLIAVFTHVSIALPSFWLGLMLIYLFAVTLGWLPAGGMPRTGGGPGSTLAHLVMPVLTLTIVEIGGPTRYVRAAMLEVLSQDYIRAADARGLSRLRVILRHALRNASIPVVTIVAHGFGHLVSGALLTETIFAWRGMGLLTLEAVMDNDYSLALVCLLLTTATVLAANIFADAACSWLDPRIRLDGSPT